MWRDLLSLFVLVRCECSRLRAFLASLLFCPLLRACWLLFVLFLACLCYFVSFDLLRLRVMVLRVGAACGCAIMRGAACGWRSC